MCHFVVVFAFAAPVLEKVTLLFLLHLQRNCSKKSILFLLTNTPFRGGGGDSGENRTFPETTVFEGVR